MKTMGFDVPREIMQLFTDDAVVAETAAIKRHREINKKSEDREIVKRRLWKKTKESEAYTVRRPDSFVNNNPASTLSVSLKRQITPKLSAAAVEVRPIASTASLLPIYDTTASFESSGYRIEFHGDP